MAMAGDVTGIAKVLQSLTTFRTVKARAARRVRERVPACGLAPARARPRRHTLRSDASHAPAVARLAVASW
jgi:predicted nuclease of restriction endonuclease-like RecB superfamily